jgi:mono/diheme cytochrome c family protein
MRPGRASKPPASAESSYVLARPYFSMVRADRGAELYRNNCAGCHGEHLNDGGFARALKGDAFRREWNGRSLGALGQLIRSTMPPGKAGQPANGEYADLVAYPAAWDSWRCRSRARIPTY